MLSRSERTGTSSTGIRATFPGSERSWLAGAVVAYLATLAVAWLCARVWASAFGISSSRLGFSGLDFVNVQVTFLTILIGTAVGAGLSSTRSRKAAVVAAAVSFGALAVGGVAGTAYSASRATRGDPVHSIATLLLPATVEAKPISGLWLRDGRDLAHGAELMLIGNTSDEIVVFDARTARPSGVPKDDYVLLRYG